MQIGAFRLGLPALLAALGMMLTPALASAAVTGALSQLAPPNDCISGSYGNETCGTENAAGMTGGGQGVAVSPDGKNAYVTNSSGIVEFSRDPSTGALAELSAPNNCIEEHNNGDQKCGDTTADGIFDAGAVVVSPDGKNVYVIGGEYEESGVGTIAEFSRDPNTGALTQLPAPNNCLEQQGGGTNCTSIATGMAAPTSLAISPDGNNVYVTSGASGEVGSGDIAEFARDPATGALTQLPGLNNCIEEDVGATDECGTVGKGLSDVSRVVVSSDGKNVYTALEITPGAVAEFSRDPLTGALSQLSAPNNCIQSSETVGEAPGECGTTTGFGIDDVLGLDTSPDGRNLYTASRDPSAPIAEFARDTSSGVLTQLAAPNNCLEEHRGSEQIGCGNQTGHGLNSAQGLKVSPDGQNVYVVSYLSDGGLNGAEDSLVELARNSDGSLTQLAAPNDCIQEVGGSDCGETSGRGLGSPTGLSISPDGASVYTVGGDNVRFGSSGGQDPVAEFARVVPPPAPQTPAQGSGSTPSASPARATSAPKVAVKAKAKKKKKKHHEKHRAHKAVKAKRVTVPRFTG